MILIKNVLQLFTSEFQTAKLFESEERFETEITFDSLNVPTENKLSEGISRLSLRDNFTLDVIIGDKEPVSLYSPETKVSDFITDLNKELGHKEEEEKIKIKFVVYKKKSNGVISIYDCKTFGEYLEQLDFVSLLESFKKAFEDTKFILFQALDGTENFNSQTIYFSKAELLEESPKEIIESLKPKKNESIKSNCHYGNSAEFDFIPNDFKLVKRSSQHEIINLLFDRLALVHCITSLFDITYNNEDGIFYKLNGYKAISGNLIWKTLTISSLDEYFKIYDWVYEGGNLSDKIGLARNIISIHFSGENTIELKGNACNSIRSGFEIYLKQNIKQYIEIRNKISDQLIDFNKRANTIVDAFAGSFQKSIFAFLSFFASVFVLRVLSKGDFKNILTPEATILSLGFLAIAVIFLLFSRWEIGKQKERFENSYSNMKERYKDLLIEGDIEKILNNDKDFNGDIAFIGQKKRKYSQMWIITLIIFLIVILLLFYLANPEIMKSLFENLSCNHRSCPYFKAH